MYKSIFLMLIAFILLSMTSYLLVQNHVSSQLDSISLLRHGTLSEWKKFKQSYHKFYQEYHEEMYRLQIFRDNLEIIQNDTTGTLGVTKFADLTQHEFISLYLTQSFSTIAEQSNQGIDYESEFQEYDDQAAGDINWITLGKVTDVKDQGLCNSGWAFSATGALESLTIINGLASLSLDLSEQQLVSCNILNQGCQGGVMDVAFKYIKDNKLTSESNYSYDASDSKCDKTMIIKPLYGLTSFSQVAKLWSSVKTQLITQPISIAVDATNWQLYTSGVFSNCGVSLNHGVLLVGYENNAWIVKNSWGTNWGENGYIKLLGGANTCGLANYAFYPKSPIIQT